ncbi:hypothetical protein Tco_1164136 [Tanacetum coccineum]
MGHLAAPQWQTRYVCLLHTISMPAHIKKFIRKGDLEGILPYPHGVMANLSSRLNAFVEIHMDLTAFIRVMDPTKVKVVEKDRTENEPRLLETTVRRVVSLLPVAPARS